MKAKVKPIPAKTVKPSEAPPDCQWCRALKNAYPDLPYSSLRLHCGQHRTSEEAMHTDGLPPVEHPTVKPEPKDEPPELVKDLLAWDGRIRTCWASAETVAPPESPAWEHVAEWVCHVREEKPKLTARAIGVLLRAAAPGEYTAHSRYRTLMAEELAAERELYRQTEQAEMRPVVKKESRQVPEMVEKVVLDHKIDATFGGTKIINENQPSNFPPPNRTKPTGEGRDKYGYKLGTRSATINAYMEATDEWLSVSDIEARTKTNSASSHLSSLKAAGHVEYMKDESRVGKYRMKKG